MPEIADSKWSDIAYHALVDGFVAPLLLQPQGNVRVECGLVLTKSRVLHPWWYSAFRITNELDANTTMDRLEAFFGDADYQIFTRDWADQDLAAAALQRGLHPEKDKPTPLMIAQGDPGTPELPDGLVIRSESSEDFRADFAELGGRIFGESEQDLIGVRQYLDASVTNNNFSEYFVGYFEGKPVAITNYWFARRVPCLYWVGVLPEYRRRGFAEAIVRTAWASARKRGAGAVTLQASTEGHPQYLRYGFRDVGTFTKYKTRSSQQA